MATMTDGDLSLVKPSVTDRISIGVINQNMDLIDEAVTRLNAKWPYYYGVKGQILTTNGDGTVEWSNPSETMTTVDDTLTKRGMAADAAETGALFETIFADYRGVDGRIDTIVNRLPSGDGNEGQVLTSKGDGTTQWMDSSGGSVTVIDNNPTLSWGQKNKVATIGGTEINVTMPENPGSGGGGSGNVSVVDNNPTLSWGSQSTVGTVGGTALHVRLPANPDTDTMYTAGATDTQDKIYIIGAKEQGAHPKTYSHDNVYIGTDGRVYSRGKRTLTTAGVTWGELAGRS